jgi:hypothetical protein
MVPLVNNRVTLNSWKEFVNLVELLDGGTPLALAHWFEVTATQLGAWSTRYTEP